MNPDVLIRGVLSSVLGGGRKRSGRALRYLTGGGSIWTRPTTLLTAAGVAWGIYETLQATGCAAAPAASRPPVAMAWSGALPPLPGVVAADVDAEALRLVRLAISAANADGVMSAKERAAVLTQAQAAGVGEVVERELNQPQPLAGIVAGVTIRRSAPRYTSWRSRSLRADEQVTGAERIYLAQLAQPARSSIRRRCSGWRRTRASGSTRSAIRGSSGG